VNLRGQDTARLWAAVVALGVSIALAAGLAVLSSSVNRPPVIESLEAQPALVARDGSATLLARASDPDGDALEFHYEADRGRVVADPRRPSEARYVPPPDGPIADRVTVTVRDPRGFTSTRSVAVTLESVAAVSEPETTAPPSIGSGEPAVAVWTPIPSRARPQPRPRPTRAPSTPEPATPPPKVNQPPVLDGGYATAGIGASPITLIATGHDPEDDAITYEWDTGGCFELLHETQTEAEVKFIDECKMGTVNLVWTDAHGARASTRWTLRR
jgi:hypothetical protein